MPCPKPPDSYITNGAFLADPAGPVDPGKSYTVECDNNYSLQGSSEAVCVSGTTFKSFPTCQGNQVVLVTCFDEYRLDNLCHP